MQGNSGARQTPPDLSVHCLTQAMERRNSHPESWFWETEDGRQWLRRLVVATLYTFGLKRGVGMETMREFFTHLRLQTQMGCAPSALRSMMQALADSTPQTSAEVESHLQETVEAIDVFAQCHQLPPRHATMIKVRQQLPALAALVDFWWEGVRRDVAHAAISPMWGRWAAASLLLLVYWEHQVAHTRCARRKTKIRQALEALQVACGRHAPPNACRPRSSNHGTHGRPTG